MSSQKPPEQLTVRQKYLIHKWQYLPVWIIARMARVNPVVRRISIADYDLLLDAGTLGLLKAARGFRPERGYKFSTYATSAIRRNIMISIMSPFAAVSIPTNAWGVESTCQFAERATVSKSLSHSMGKDPSVTHREFIDTLIAPEIIPFPADEAERVHNAIKRLPSRMQKIIELRFWKGMTLEQIGVEANGVGKERARQLLAQAIEKLRILLKQKGDR